MKPENITILTVVDYSVSRDAPTRNTSNTVCIVAKIFHVYIMVQTAWKARLGNLIISPTFYCYFFPQMYINPDWVIRGGADIPKQPVVFTVQNPDELYVLVSSALPTTRCDMTCTVLKAT